MKNTGKPSFKSFYKHEVTTGLAHNLILCDRTGRLYKEKRRWIAFALYLGIGIAVLIVRIQILNSDNSDISWQAYHLNETLNNTWFFGSLVLVLFVIPLRYFFAKFEPLDDEEWTEDDEHRHRKASRNLIILAIILLLLGGLQAFFASHIFDTIATHNLTFLLPKAIAVVAVIGILLLAALSFLAYLLADERKRVKQRKP